MRNRILGLEAGVADAQGWLERRLESAIQEQRSDLLRRLNNFESGDRRFKEWVQRELHEDLSGQLQQVKTIAADAQQQQQRQSAAIGNQCHRLDLRIQDLEANYARAEAKTDGVARALQANSSSMAAAGTAPPHVEAALTSLSTNLEREVSARSALATEVSQRVKELHGVLTTINQRLDHDAFGRHQQIAEINSQSQARVAALEPNFATLRSELDAVQEQLRRTVAEAARRCEETERSCVQRVAGVQESALSAARELWEEHSSVVAECKTSMASLQQILDTKDRMGAQLQALLQQQRQDDWEGLLGRLLHGDDVLRGRLTEVETALAHEQAVRLEAHQQTSAHANRIGMAVEKAQAQWLKDSERIAGELSNLRRDVDSQSLQEGRGWERRLAESLDAAQRRLEEQESRVAQLKTQSADLEVQVANLGHAREADRNAIETQLRRRIDEVVALQAEKLSQCDAEIRSTFQTALTEASERARSELASVQESAATERSTLRTTVDEAAKESEARSAALREEVERRLGTMLADSQRQALQTAEALAQCRTETVAQVSEVRAYTEGMRQEVVARTEASINALIDDMAQKAAHAEHLHEELSQEIASLDERQTAALAGSEAKAAARLADALGLEREQIMHEVERLVEEEKSARIQSETERLASLQKRLAASEDLSLRRIEDLRVRQDDAHASHRQEVDSITTAATAELRTALDEAAQSVQQLQADLDDLRTSAAEFQEAQAQAHDATKAETAAAKAEVIAQLTEELQKLQLDLENLRTSCKQQQEAEAESSAAREQVAAEQAEALEKVRSELESFHSRFSEFQAESSASREQVAAEQATALENVRSELGSFHTRLSEFQAESSAAREQAAAEQAEALEKVRSELEGLRTNCSEFQAESSAAKEQEAAQHAEALRNMRSELESLHVSCSESQAQTLQTAKAEMATLQADISAEHADALEKLRGDIQSLGTNCAQLQESQAKASEDLQGKMGLTMNTIAEARAASSADTAELRGTLDKSVQQLRADLEALQAATTEFQAAQTRANEAQTTAAAKAEANGAKAEDLVKQGEALSRLQSELESMQADHARSQEVEARTTAATKAEAAVKAEAAAEQAEALQKMQVELEGLRTTCAKLQEAEVRASADVKAETAAKAEVAAEQAKAMQGVRADLENLRASCTGIQEAGAKINAAQDAINKAQAQKNEAQDRLNKDCETKASAATKSLTEALAQLRARVDGGFHALVVQLEVDRWTRSAVDGVADGISQHFLNHLDQTSVKLTSRVQKCENALPK